jgi:hypothetical protein
MDDKIKEYLLYFGIFSCLMFVLLRPDPNSVPKITPPSMEEFDEVPIVAWRAYDRKGGPCIKIRYKVQRDKTRLYMFAESGKLVHQTPLALDRFKDGRERTETYVWKLYRTEWTSDIDPGYYTIVVGTDHDKRGIGTEIEVL